MNHRMKQSFVLNPIKQFLRLLIVISPSRLFKTFKMQFQENGIVTSP